MEQNRIAFERWPQGFPAPSLSLHRGLPSSLSVNTWLICAMQLAGQEIADRLIFSFRHAKITASISSQREIKE